MFIVSKGLAHFKSQAFSHTKRILEDILPGMLIDKNISGFLLWWGVL